MSSKLTAVALAFAAATTALIAHGEDRRNPILDYSGGPGNPYLAVPKLHFRFGPTPAPTAGQRDQKLQLGIVRVAESPARPNHPLLTSPPRPSPSVAPQAQMIALDDTWLHRNSPGDGK